MSRRGRVQNAEQPRLLESPAMTQRQLRLGGPREGKTWASGLSYVCDDFGLVAGAGRMNLIAAKDHITAEGY
jgi:hypothetical protein